MHFARRSPMGSTQVSFIQRGSALRFYAVGFFFFYSSFAAEVPVPKLKFHHQDHCPWTSIPPKN